MTARGRKKADAPATEAVPTAEIRLGRWEDVLGDVRPDTVISDPPYGKRTHEWSRIVNDRQEDDCERTPIDYAHWTPADVDAFVQSWAFRSSCWIVAMTSHDLVPHWMDSYDSAGWYPFPPIAAVISGMSVRMSADGPASWTIHICVARRRAKRLGVGSSVWRSLPGGYTGPATEDMAGGRGKPRWLLDALVRDYSDPGMTIVDPCAGWGSTLVAARNAGRNAVGAEMDPAAFARAQHALSGDMTAYRRSKPVREREPDPTRPGLFDTLRSTQ